MRDHLAHQYFATEAELIQQTLDDDLGPLLQFLAVASVRQKRRALQLW
jgi:uncharacterized protein with HEPN domain